MLTPRFSEREMVVLRPMPHRRRVFAEAGLGELAGRGWSRKGREGGCGGCALTPHLSSGPQVWTAWAGVLAQRQPSCSTVCSGHPLDQQGKGRTGWFGEQPGQSSDHCADTSFIQGYYCGVGGVPVTGSYPLPG